MHCVEKDALLLIEQLCAAYEAEQLGDDTAPEVMRVVQALAEGGRVRLAVGSPLSACMSRRFPGTSPIWGCVTLVDADT